ncbi:MAG: hypothetical protein RKO66_14710 [Candidatus Contendobacter sp.]|nr:hypothetical protein [Candidatus Contendobacter sp.]MDS4060552.1 hypothetical protein [Candidatus Contendobacter sp.]
MRDTIRILRNLGLYLLPAFLLATTGALLMVLLRPLPSAVPSNPSHTAVIMDQDEYWRSHAETLFAAMMAEALRQYWEERQDNHARTLEYRYERFLPLEEQPTTPSATPPSGPDGGVANRPPLIHL